MILPDARSLPHGLGAAHGGTGCSGVAASRVRTGSLRTQSARHRVDHGTICGRSCANSGHYKPLGLGSCDRESPARDDIQYRGPGQHDERAGHMDHPDISYDFRVAPLGEGSEMLMVRPESEDFVFPAGRYGLVIKGQAYDFTIAGPITEPVQCLEGIKAENGTFYSECRRPPEGQL